MTESTQPQEFMALEARWLRICQDLTVGTLNRMSALPTNPGGWDGPYREILGVARRAVDDTLALERDWVDACTRFEESVPYTEPFAKGNATLVRAAIDGREPLWHAWFDAAEHLADAGPAANALAFPVNAAFQAWKDAMEGIQQTAAETAAPQSAAKTGQTAEKPAKGTKASS
ncbi:hypothetical protein [Arhodomonas sp. AD133]|uniref:hypothetical protein n=1 Tax=Arhodomonas sp. AD133 TaxID=3415009 RepID=UPI003EBE9E91